MDTPTPTSEGVATYHTYLDGLVQQAGTLTKPTCCRTSRSAADLDLSAVPFAPSMCSGDSGSGGYSQLYAEYSPSPCLHATASKSATSPTPTTSAFSTLNTNSTMMAALDSGFGIIDDTKKDTSMTPSSPPSSSSSSVSLFHASKSSNSIATSQQQHQQQAAPFFDFDTALASPRLRFESTSDNIFHFDDDVFPTTTAATATADGGAINVGATDCSQGQGNDGAFLPAFTLNSDVPVEQLLSHADMNMLDAALESFLSPTSTSSPTEERQASAASSASALSAASFSSSSSDAEDPIPLQSTSHTTTTSSFSSCPLSLPSSQAQHRTFMQAQPSSSTNSSSNSSVRAKGTASTTMRGRSAINKRCVLENGEIDHEKLERTREIARRSYWRRRNRELTGRRTVRQRLTLLNKTKDLLVQKRQRLLKERQALLDHVRQHLHTLHPIGTIDQHPSPLFF
ncbi:hypothetical protein PTSG_07716 [Salpingoeca rosetta]|uniref:Uncharacterized protein n=1 Tax=Salpingoeca rosetta (strain ATCC 50818 / BSB-021) TaxID=946362 RepID=F2UHK0_SALR5|nr:uncharacterized protein PTSG_07716 [Salpingoeca rosetta]EGD76599.1 hypothetical protein PTSG_07716 [Salpingoeca rosetta]|eukprot:XP_004991513.1 hypothetical protein PTSG_07716 [Salpingoeca rosetta]